jgi:peroxin-6
LHTAAASACKAASWSTTAHVAVENEKVWTSGFGSIRGPSSFLLQVMSLFFNNTQSVDVSFTVKSLPEKNGFDTVLVGKDIWTRFKQSGCDRVGLSIRSIHPLRNGVLKREPLRELTCWAVLDEEVGFHFLPLSGLKFMYIQVAEFSIPPKWLQTFGHIFSHSTFHQGLPEKTLNVTGVQPVLVTGIIVTALSREAYVAASSYNSSIETWLSDESLILRQGAVHTFGSDLLPTNGHGASGSRRFYRYRLDMLEPVLQGYALKGSTRFYITFADSSNEYSSPEDDSEAGDESGSDPDGIEIDECFLASSILHSTQNMTPLSPRETVTNRLRDTNVEPGEPTTSHAEFRFRTEPLPVPRSASQDDCTLYLRTSDLGRIGILNGDWVRFLLCLGLSQIFIMTRRLLSIRVEHQVIVLFKYMHAMIWCPLRENYDFESVGLHTNLVPIRGTAMGSPLLLHNIHPVPRSQISVQASPFGSHQPVIPIARNVTIARVASPISVDRTYQPMFLHFLKAHFASTRRLVKQGDLIAISLDTDTIGRLGGSQPDDLADPEDLDIFDE